MRWGTSSPRSYWHCVRPDGLHLTISDTGWGKALWGKFYGQWMCEGAVFAYDFDRFDAANILPMFAKYHITTFCAPPTMYRMLIKEDLVAATTFPRIELCHDRGRGAEPRGVPPVQDARRDCRSWRASVRPRRR